VKKEIFILAVITAVFSGCAIKEVDGTICEKIGKDRNEIDIPNECRKYSEEDADKAMKSPKQKDAESRESNKGDIKLIDKAK
jgi:hypothetical protein